MKILTSCSLKSKFRTLAFICLGISLLSLNTGYASDDVEIHLDAIRGIKAIDDDEKLKKFNQQLDTAWSYFKASKEESNPILERELELELERRLPNDFFLLDIGYFLYLHGNEAQRVLAKRALYSLDASKKIIQFNLRQLFDFSYNVAADRDPKILSFLNDTFLTNQEQSLFIPMHSMRLDPTLICVFLYGIYGEGAEDALMAQLTKTSQPNRIIEILSWIGSEKSSYAVEIAMYKNKNYDTLARAVSFFMTVAGKKGNQILSSFNPEGFDKESQEYYQKIREPIRKVSFESIYKQLESFPGDKRLSDRQLKVRLDEMYNNFGKDQKTSPLAILNSSMAKTDLIEQLKKIRSRTFYRLSDEALSDVKITNALINALYYK